jgi:diguanylate cyclase (GGDEF)-like protein
LTFYLDYRSQIEASTNVQRQLVRTLQSQAEVAAFASNAEIANDVLTGLMTHAAIVSVQLSATHGFKHEQVQDPAPQGDSSEQIYPLFSPVDGKSLIGELRVRTDDSAVSVLAIRSAVNNALLLVLQLLMTALVLGAAFRRVVGRPVTRLAGQLAAIQPGGSDRLPIAPHHLHDEIGKLSSSANSLLDAAEHALQEERALRFKVEAMEQHYRRIFESTHVGIMVLHADGRLINSNPILLQKIVGIQFNGEYTPQSEDFLSAIFVQPELAWSMVREASAQQRSVAGDLQLKTSDARASWAHCILSASQDAQGRMDIIEGVLYDVTQRRKQEEEARQMAELDALTGLHNRRGTEVLMSRSLRHAAEDAVSVGVLMIDLDGFKAVNDTFGHGAGDTVLIEIARRLRECTRRSADLVGRLGGDEFVVMTYDSGDTPELLAQIASDIVATLSKPIQLETGDQAHIGASVGIARYPQAGVTCEALLHSADLAMYGVKRRGKNGFAFSPDGAAATVR